MPKEKKKLHWVKLDNAAKIYPAARRMNWSNLFRQSVTLTEEVDIPVLQEALDVVVKRFPSIAARLRKGAFWYYLQQVASAPQIREEYSYPLVYMDKEEMRRCAFRVIVHHNRIAVEFFHALTDGSGALIRFQRPIKDSGQTKAIKEKNPMPFRRGERRGLSPPRCSH